MKVFKTSKWDDEIEEVEATRTSDKRIYYLNRRNEEAWSPRNGSYAEYFNTRELAIQHLKDRLERDIRLTEEKLAKLKNRLDLLTPFTGIKEKG